MPNQLRVIKLGLEQTVLNAREKGLSLAQIAAACNAELKRRTSGETISKPAVERYLASLDKASVPVAHQPQLAQENAVLAIDFAKRLTRLDELLGEWLEQVNDAVTPVRGVLWDPASQAAVPTAQANAHHDELRDKLTELSEFIDTASIEDWIAPAVVLIPDWPARARIAKELRQLLDLYADVMGRIHDAQQIKDFQESIMEAIRDASPDVARDVTRRLASKRDARKAALLGAAA